MTEKGQREEKEHWGRRPELPADAFNVLQKPNRRINPIAILATVDEDGSPRTAPFGSLRAVTPKLLRLCCNHHHDTYRNLHRDRRVMVAVLAPPNIAIGISGQARVVKEIMDIADYMAVVEIDIEEVKNDMMRRGKIESEIGFSPPEDLREFYIGAIAEIEC
jgi:uncharacterized pyridoxamine 5'-phosphate oxidase family protein